jgi:hypothetical protein
MAKMKLTPHRLEKSEETECEWCGWPLYAGEIALYTSGDERVYCCRCCAEDDRNNRTGKDSQ